MGMAASQARFLGLTARKTNTEYEGQQVNQQRTMLSNKSANYYNDLLGMTVPTPPSVDDYTKTIYTFNDGALENTVNSMVAQADGQFLVSYTRSWTNDNAIVSASSSIITLSGGDKTSPDAIFSIGSKQLRHLGDIDAMKALAATDDYLKTFTTDEEFEALAKEEALYKSMLEEKYGESAEGWMVIYRQDSTTEAWIPTFYNEHDLRKNTTTYSSTGASESFIPAYTTGSAIERDEVKGAKAMLEKDSSGRYINITLYDEDGNGTTYALTTNATTDQAAYNDAMNQYEYNKTQYDKSVQDINSKIEIIQAEDRSLELRLKQLDTEQKAIQTEMEAVTKVIEKNTSDTFKTFSG